MKPITTDILAQIAPLAPKKLLEELTPWIAAEMCYREINTLNRASFFLSQAAHETDGFKTLTEYASGRAYENRHDIGNFVAGDGVRFVGRGIFQTTGRANYEQVSKNLGVDFVTHPELLATPEWAVKSAGIYWKKIKGNGLADLPDTWRSATKHYSPFQYLSYRINGGLTGYASREVYLKKALKALAPLFA